MSQSFVKKPYQGSHSALAGLGVLGHEQRLTSEQQRILDAIPKRCEPCRATGAVHCSDPANCGGPWDDHARAQWLLYEHDDGRHAVAPSAEAATFTKGDPAWHRVGPVQVPDGLARALQIVEAEIARAEALLSVEESGAPIFDRAQTEAGIAALRTVAAAIEQERNAGVMVAHQQVIQPADADGSVKGGAALDAIRQKETE